MSNTDKAWEKWGSTDPYFGVLSSEEYRKANLSDEAKRRFFGTGEHYIDQVLQTARQHLDPGFHPRRSLDFGCGVGRLALPLAKISEAVTGIDVSDAMLAETRQNCEAQGLKNVHLLKSDDDLRQLSGSYDLIHSCLVFQHIPPRRGERICARLLEHLGPGGIAIMQFYYHCFAPKLLRGLVRARYHLPPVNWLRNFVKGRALGEAPMELHIYDLRRLVLLFHRNQITNIFLEPYRHEEFASVLIYGQKKQA